MKIDAENVIESLFNRHHILQVVAAKTEAENFPWGVIIIIIATIKRHHLRFFTATWTMTQKKSPGLILR